MDCAREQTYGSMSWVKASMTVLAVRAGGNPCVNSGSTSAARASMRGLRRLALTRWAGEASQIVAGVQLSGTPGFAFEYRNAPAGRKIFFNEPQLIDSIDRRRRRPLGAA